MSRPGARLLMIEDDRSARESVGAALTQMGYTVLGRPTGEDLDEALSTFRPDLAIIDINLPSGPDGFALARQVRASAGVPVLFLTAADTLASRLSGFEAGGDDYLVKPFAMAELLARIRAVLRRSGRLQSSVTEVRDLVIDEGAKTAVRAGHELDLTPTEYELLCALVRTPGKVVSKAQLLSLVWGFDAYDANVVEVHVSSLRRKMEAHGPRLVHTERGRGYVLRP
ncbi:MAG TPA: response regulator transcription factor [Acidimicrobiales bacterium]|nr:response regulator transcription factor [Acidimicrobiales bacterium]